MKYMEKYQCDKCLLIVTGLDIGLCPECLEPMRKILNISKECCIDCKNWAGNPKAVRNTCLQCPCHRQKEPIIVPHPKDDLENWEKEFDKKWVKLFEEGSWPMIGIEIKQFIRHKLSSNTERVKKEIKKMNFDINDRYGITIAGEILEDIINNIK